MRRLLLFVVAVVLTACGGSVEETPDTTPTSSSQDTTVESESPTSQASATTTTEDSEPAPPLQEADIEPGTGVVVLDGTEYVFDISGRCQVEDGSMGAAGPRADGSEGSVEAILPSPAMQSEVGAPYVLVALDDAETWIAQNGYEPQVLPPPSAEESAVLELQVTGSSATGTALFWETSGQGTLEGSFALRCP